MWWNRYGIVLPSIYLLVSVTPPPILLSLFHSFPSRFIVVFFANVETSKLKLANACRMIKCICKMQPSLLSLQHQHHFVLFLYLLVTPWIPQSVCSAVIFRSFSFIPKFASAIFRDKLVRYIQFSHASPSKYHVDCARYECEILIVDILCRRDNCLNKCFPTVVSTKIGALPPFPITVNIRLHAILFRLFLYCILKTDSWNTHFTAGF